ncbi:hypothetical protein GPECTOR_1g628 [Gonium pectorale]|uniref:Uncharacterized protein n=1 Tax=Gonium pectorale TaxID=33097 RepID=A0A150H3F4_GONPE|nr:hypothetical protein GPECTOR_1g628 [Gonium pectorale]|eukprot:KXZ56697.1 hypothetical protein GPECTOR_1g628 [Gonium pectorale]
MGGAAPRALLPIPGPSLTCPVPPTGYPGLALARVPATPAKRSAKVGSIGSLAASLLVFPHVVKGAVGEAFLSALAVTQKYQASSKEILAAYSRFYSLLLTAGYDSWQDYVLDQILLGRDNAFARAAAQGTLDPGAPLHKAVAYDLDVLQELSLSLSQARAAPGEG